MTVQRILVERGIGETRAAAFDSRGQAISVFLRRDNDEGKRAGWGTHTDGIVRELAPSQGGAFVELSKGEGALLTLGQGKPPAIGTRVNVEIASEARRDKLARVKLIKSGPVDARTPLEAWRQALPGGSEADLKDVPIGDETLSEVFDQALAPDVVIPGGGRLRFSPTPALLAIDIDTAGRTDKGRAAARAETVNKAALIETARQLSIRRSGGAVVVDCIGPIPDPRRAILKTTLGDVWRRISSHRIAIIPPSAFGLLQASLTRHAAPLDEVLLDEAGEPTAETTALEGLRQLARAGVTDRSSQLTLHLPERAYAFHKEHAKAHMEALIDRFGARIDIQPSVRAKIEISRS